MKYLNFGANAHVYSFIYIYQTGEAKFANQMLYFYTYLCLIK